MHELQIRRETEDDVAAVHRVVERAFAGVEHSDQTEPHIIDVLRRAGALTASLVAVSPDVIGHAPASPGDDLPDESIGSTAQPEGQCPARVAS